MTFNDGRQRYAAVNDEDEDPAPCHDDVGDETARPSTSLSLDSLEPMPVADGAVSPAALEEWSPRKACAVVLLGMCAFAGLVLVGERGGEWIRARWDPDERGGDTLDMNDQHRMRGPAASLTESSALDVLDKGREVGVPGIDFGAIDGLAPIDKILLEFLSGSSLGREKAVQLLTREYISDEAPETSAYDRFDDAVEAMQLQEEDGEPVQIKGHPYLFVGSVGAAANRNALKRHGITHVVSWSTTARCGSYPEIEYMCIRDVMNCEDMRRHMDELDAAVDYIEAARRSGGRAMSQCWYGRNRSVTLLVAYLMKYQGYGGEEALELIQQTRPIADSYRDSVYVYGRDYVKNGGRK